MAGIYRAGDEASSQHKEVYNSKVTHQHFYQANDNGQDSDEGEGLLERKRAWAELEREQAEIKRNIRGLMKTTPESRAIEDPMLADRVRSVRYEPTSYN